MCSGCLGLLLALSCGHGVVSVLSYWDLVGWMDLRRESVERTLRKQCFMRSDTTLVWS